MNKSAIALAIAAAMAATAGPVYAETTLYGSARVSIDWVDQDVQDDENIPLLDSNDDYWEVVNNSSRLGVRGSEDLGNGLSAIYQYEFGVNVTGNTSYFNSNRPRWVGLKGDSWGAVTLGTQWTPYYNNSVGYLDQFNSGRSFGYYLRNQNIDGVRTGIAEFRRGTSVVYTTPNWSGFDAQAMLVMDGEGGKDSVDQWELGAKYNNAGFFAGFGYIGDEVTDDDQYSIALGYSTNSFGVGFAWQHYDPSDDLQSVTPADQVDAYALQGSYTFGNNIIRATYAYIDPDDLSEVNYWEVGYQYNMSKRTRLWVEYIGFEDDNDFSADSDAVSFGIRHDF